MLFATSFSEGTGQLFCLMAIFLAVVIMCAKKFANDNPEVKDAAKKAAAGKAIQLIGRLFK
jgi:hypothetical protein